MGMLLSTFTFDRNTFRRSASDSARSVAAYIDRVLNHEDLSGDDKKTARNNVGALGNYMGIFAKSDADEWAPTMQWAPTELTRRFQFLFTQNVDDSWRWLVTRSLWLFVVPNGTECRANPSANELGVSFAFFRNLLNLMVLLSAQPGNRRFLYFEEFCVIYNDDRNWNEPASSLFQQILNLRESDESKFNSQRCFLEDLEKEYDVPRDNLNGMFSKAFNQTGLFETQSAGNKSIAFALRRNLESTLQNRLSFILDNSPPEYAGNWVDHLGIHEKDLPVEVIPQDEHISLVDRFDTTEISGIVPAAVSTFTEAKLSCVNSQVLRFIASLLTKKFLIVTGLSGSGKTKLAQAFAAWMCSASDSGSGQLGSSYAIVPVGADWMGNENILGYADGLDSNRYVSKPTLSLILDAIDRPDIPHFLILDEMNLSHVERYFADLLSAIESGEPIPLHQDKERFANDSAVPSSLKLPGNIFIIGTVNVDETTYMFSPKVLDRSNVIEFRMLPEEMASYLDSPDSPDLDAIYSQGQGFSSVFLEAANKNINVPESLQKRFHLETQLFFDSLKDHGAEFGYRVAHDASRLLTFCDMLSTIDSEAEGDGEGEGTVRFDSAFDVVVAQKVLPKLHGSRTQLGPLLKQLWFLCTNERGDDGTLESAREAARSTNRQHEPSVTLPPGSRYPVSAEKLGRMWRLLNDNGFTSFAEA